MRLYKLTHKDGVKTWHAQPAVAVKVASNTQSAIEVLDLDATEVCLLLNSDDEIDDQDEA